MNNIVGIVDTLVEKTTDVVEKQFKTNKHIFFSETESDEGKEVTLSTNLENLSQKTIVNTIKKKIKITRKQLEDIYESYFEIVIFNAANLPVKNSLTGLNSDPYVSVELIDTKTREVIDCVQTKVTYNTLNAVFNQKLLMLDETKIDFDNSKLRFTVYDYEKMSSDKVIGFCEVYFDELTPGYYVDLEKELVENNKTYGSLSFSVKYTNSSFHDMKKDCIQFIERFNNILGVLGFQKDSYIFIIPNERIGSNKLRRLLQTEFEGASDTNCIHVDTLTKVLDFIRMRVPNQQHVIKFTCRVSDKYLYELPGGERKMDKTTATSRFVEGNYSQLVSKILTLAWNTEKISDYITLHSPWMLKIGTRWNPELKENVSTLGDASHFVPLHTQESLVPVAHRTLSNYLRNKKQHGVSGEANFVGSVNLAEILTFVRVGAYPDDEKKSGYNRAARFKVSIEECDKRNGTKGKYCKTVYVAEVSHRMKVIAEFAELGCAEMDDDVINEIMNKSKFKDPSS
jgi:hypothetical protein